MLDKVLVLIGVTAACMLSPGPDMLLVTRNTLARGRDCGRLTALGVLTGNLVHVSYCTLGIAWLLSQSIVVYTLLRIGSAIYLIDLGTRSSLDSEVDIESEMQPSSVLRGSYIRGLITNLLNPKGSLFYLGVFSQLITPELSVADRCVLVAVMIGVSASFWVVFVQTMNWPAARARLLRSRLIVNRVFGVLLILLGAKVAVLLSMSKTVRSVAPMLRLWRPR